MARIPKTKPIPTQFSDMQKRLLEAYVTLCYEKGPTTVTLQMVADQAKVAFGTVRYHFAGEHLDLMRAALIYVVTNGQKFTQDFLNRESLTPHYNGVLTYFHATFELAEKHPSYVSYLFHFYYLCTTEVDLVVNNKTFLETAYARLRGLIFEAIGRGHYPQRKDVDGITQQLHATLVGSVLMSLSKKDKNALRTSREQTCRHVDHILKLK